MIEPVNHKAPYGYDDKGEPYRSLEDRDRDVLRKDHAKTYQRDEFTLHVVGRDSLIEGVDGSNVLFARRVQWYFNRNSRRWKTDAHYNMRDLVTPPLPGSLRNVSVRVTNVDSLWYHGFVVGKVKFDISGIHDEDNTEDSPGFVMVHLNDAKAGCVKCGVQRCEGSHYGRCKFGNDVNIYEEDTLHGSLLWERKRSYWRLGLFEWSIYGKEIKYRRCCIRGCE